MEIKNTEVYGFKAAVRGMRNPKKSHHLSDSFSRIDNDVIFGIYKNVFFDEAMKELPEKIDSYFGIAGISGAKNDFMTTVSVDFISNKVKCNCNSQKEKEDYVEKNETESFLMSIYKETNFEILYCSHIMFKKDILKNNYGFYITLTLFILELVLSISYFYQNIVSQRCFHYSFLIPVCQPFSGIPKREC